MHETVSQNVNLCGEAFHSWNSYLENGVRMQYCNLPCMSMQ